MLILPSERSKILLPQKRVDWQRPSAERGHKVVHRLTARLDDGHIVWRGWFEDREDADAFLYAIANDSLRYERELWRLPNPWWSPDIGYGENLSYEFQTVVALTTQGSGTYSTPVDWNPANNTIEGIGAGSNGAAGSVSAGGNGGVGGCYAIANNLSITGTINVNVGAGNGSTGSGTSPSSNTWFENGSTLVAAGAATATTNCVGSAKSAGGPGGNSSSGAGGGGGGAGGPNGAGASGSNGTGSTRSGSGGQGDDGNGGMGGPGISTGNAGNNGNPGDEWSAAGVGAGGGGGGGLGSSTGASGGNGGAYGAAGGGAGNKGSATGGTAAGGLIVITYMPLIFSGAPRLRTYLRR